MEYKQLLDITNVLIVAAVTCLMNMGLSSPLIWTQLSEVLGSAAKGLVDDLKLDVVGNDVESVTKTFAAGLKKIGACQIVELQRVDDSEIELGLGECVFAPACAALRGGDDNSTPPCSHTAMLASAIRGYTGRTASIEHYTWKPNASTCSFKMSVE
jgi:hypothetical protein